MCELVQIPGTDYEFRMKNVLNYLLNHEMCRKVRLVIFATLLLACLAITWLSFWSNDESSAPTSGSQWRVWFEEDRASGLLSLSAESTTGLKRHLTNLSVRSPWPEYHPKTPIACPNNKGLVCLAYIFEMDSSSLSLSIFDPNGSLIQMLKSLQWPVRAMNGLST